MKPAAPYVYVSKRTVEFYNLAKEHKNDKEHLDKLIEEYKLRKE